MISRYFNLNLNAGLSVPLVINANQYDRGESWIFTLYDSSGVKYIPSSGAIVGIKSDNLGIINSGTVDSEGRVVINETQQMTAAVGKAVFELLIDDQTHGTANFIVLVEPKPGDNADFSESDLSLLQEAIDGTSAAAIAQGVSDWMDENLTPTTPVVDSSLTVQGAAADAKKTGDEISDLKSQIALNSGIPVEVKTALDTILQNVGFKNTDVYTDELAVIHTWATSVNLISISAVYTQSGRVFETDSLNSLKNNLVVTASYDDGSSVEVSGYELSGTLAEGTCAITVTYQNKTTSFNVTVTGWSVAWSYEDGDLPDTVAPNDWTASTAYSATAVFESGKGIKASGVRNTYSTYTLKPTNFLSVSNGVAEMVLNFASMNSEINVRATLGDATDCVIGFIGKDGIRINGGSNSVIPNTGISANTNYTFRVERTATEGRVYLDGDLVWSGEVRDLAQESLIMMSSYASLSTATVLYIKAVRFYSESV